MSETVIINTGRELILWGFRTEIRDRRTGEEIDGFIVISADATDEYEEAQEKVKREYNKLGYELTGCEFDKDHYLNINLLETYKLLNTSAPSCDKCVYNIKEDRSVGQERDCQLSIDLLDEDDAKKSDKLIEYMLSGGRNCTECVIDGKLAMQQGQPQPNFIADIMQELESIDEPTEDDVTDDELEEDDE